MLRREDGDMKYTGDAVLFNASPFTLKEIAGLVKQAIAEFGQEDAPGIVESVHIGKVHWLDGGGKFGMTVYGTKVPPIWVQYKFTTSNGNVFQLINLTNLE